MHSTQVQTSDGRLFTISGGNADQVAEIVRNGIVQNQPANRAPADEAEEGYAAPALNFAKSKDAPATNAEDEAESALAMPATF